MSSLHHCGRFVAVALLTFAIGGCGGASEGDATPRAAVSGTVTLDGKPLPGGTIQFDPESEGAAASASAEIDAGKFSIDRANGLVPGKYRVSISSRRAPQIKPDENPGAPPPAQPETVPARYNTQSTLSKDVTADGPNEFDFALVTK